MPKTKKTTSNRSTSSKKRSSQKEEDKLGNLVGELENSDNF